MSRWNCGTSEASLGSGACGRDIVEASMPSCKHLIWPNLLNAITCLILFSYIVDAADHGKIESSCSELRHLLDKPQLANIPILVLGNKNDLEGALGVDELIEQLYVYSPQIIDYILIYSQHRHLSDISNREVSCFSISAKNQVNIDITLQWLMQHAKSNWSDMLHVASPCGPVQSENKVYII